MSVYEYRGDPGLGYLRLACAHGTAPFTDLKPGDLVDFGEHEPPDSRWVEAPDAKGEPRLPDNHPDNQPAVHYPEPEDAQPQDATPEPDPEPADTAPATDTPKRSKTPAKTAA